MNENPIRLPKRESEILEVVYMCGEASAKDVEEAMEDSISNAAIRAFLNILVAKGHLKFEKRGRKFIYQPTVSREKAGLGVLRNAVSTFFGGSISQAVAGILSNNDTKLSMRELESLESLIAEAKKKENNNQ